MNLLENINTSKALKRFGGFVRYYDTTEPLSELMTLVSGGNYRDILACCGGGDQALSMLGAIRKKCTIWVADINPAQLFVLAAKATYLKQKNSLPSFGEIQKFYPGKVVAVKKNIRPLHLMKLYHIATGKIITPPLKLSENYALVSDDEMFALSKSGPYWQKDSLFLARVRARLGFLRFARMDLFDSADYFKQGSLDLIYISDIFWSENLIYFQEKLARMAKLLRWGGRIISHLDEGDDFMGKGISPGQILARHAQELNLKVVSDRVNSRYLVLERIGNRS